MISKLGQIITDLLIRENIVKISEKEIYEYGVELLISTLVNLFIIILIGVLSGQIIECIIFFCVFCLMRFLCGGFHAESYLKCTLLFTSILLSVLLINHMLYNISYHYWIIMYLFSAFIIGFLSPIDNPNKLLTNEEKHKFKIYSIIETLIWLIISLFMFAMKNKLYQIIILALFNVSTLILYTKFKGEEFVT